MNINTDMPPKRMFITALYEVLKKYTGDNYKLSSKEIAERLMKDYGIYKTDKKTGAIKPVATKRVTQNLLEMRALDDNIECEQRITGRTYKKGSLLGESVIEYYDWRLTREFTDAELRLLIDGLLFHKHIPHKQRGAMIKKLEGLSNTYFSAKVKHIRCLPENMPQNKELLYTTEVLDEAISEKKKVRFNLSHYGRDKKRHLWQGDGSEPKEYKVSPYQMAAADARYYLIAAFDKTAQEEKSGEKGKPFHFRLDFITNIEITDEPIRPIREIAGIGDGSLADYIREHPHMWGGEPLDIKFWWYDKTRLSAVYDWFGMDVCFGAEEENRIQVRVKAAREGMFYWALQYGTLAEVTQPAELRDDIRKTLIIMLDRYGADGLLLKTGGEAVETDVLRDNIKKAADYLLKGLDEGCSAEEA